MKIAMDKVFQAVKDGHSANIIAQLREAGIVMDSMPGKVGFLHRPAREIILQKREDGSFAYDAQSELVTVSNAGIPAWLTNYWDPRLIEILTSPLKAAQIAGSEVSKGDWTVTTATFMTVERVGQVSSYGDYNTNGMSAANINFPQRQAYRYQGFAQWGELQLDIAAKARVNYANEVNAACLLAMAQFQNASYFFGIAGLQNYGLLNDPALPAAIVATARWNAAATDATTIYEDIRRLFVQLQLQSNGVIDLETPVVLAMSPTILPALNKTNQFNVNVYDLLKKNFPNIRIETAVQYGQRTGGEFVQMFAESVQGQRTLEVAFTEKMRAHAVVVGHSSWSQKKSAGTFGAVLYNSFAVASMTGV